MKFFLKKANEANHQWYPIWLMAYLTGMRNGELFALKWEDLQVQWDTNDASKDLIRVSRSYNKRLREYKTTKSGDWRNIPISRELKVLLRELKVSKAGDNKHGSFVLPRFRDWERGYQARVLKMFLNEIGLPEIKFHALRACFATSLLSEGVASPVVMKICGWKDLKTMEFYIRLAGVSEKGVTECLKLFEDPNDILINRSKLLT